MEIEEVIARLQKVAELYPGIKVVTEDSHYGIFDLPETLGRIGFKDTRDKQRPLSDVAAYLLSSEPVFCIGD